MLNNVRFIKLYPLDDIDNEYIKNIIIYTDNDNSIIFNKSFQLIDLNKNINIKRIIISLYKKTPLNIELLDINKKLLYINNINDTNNDLLISIEPYLIDLNNFKENLIEKFTIYPEEEEEIIESIKLKNELEEQLNLKIQMLDVINQKFIFNNKLMTTYISIFILLIILLLVVYIYYSRFLTNK
jgi:hypothetical protein